MSTQIVAGNYVGGVPQTGYFSWLAGLGYDGSGVIWSITDTGVDYDHPDLNIVGGYTYPGCPAGDGPGDDPSTGGHGTHVAGIIAAKDNDHGVVGIAPGARIHSLDVVRPEGYALLSDMLAALEYVLDVKAAHPNTPGVLNISLGAYVGTDEYNALDEMLEQVIAAGVTVVVSAGNDFVDASLYSPAHVDEAITVGAMLSSNFFAPFSNHGAQVDVLARGEAVLSTAPGDQYATMWGTSQATAVAAGAAATYLWRNPTASPAEVHDALLSHAKKQARPQGLPDATTRAGVYVKKM
jgi:subtilisin family serine protease